MSDNTSRRAVMQRRKVPLNYLSPKKQRGVNKLVQSCFGPLGLFGEDDSELTFAESYLKSQFWSKYTGSDASLMTGRAYCTPEERRAKAIEKWLNAEKRNASTNARLEVFKVSFGSYDSEDVIHLASKYIKRVIGDSPPPVMMGEYTNGASTRVKRSASAIASKFEGKAHATPSAISYFSRILFDLPGWGMIKQFHFGNEVVLQNTSVLFTVPKNSEIDRVACKEPEINMYLQRAAGLFIRNRLKRHGIDLQDQSKNRRLAKEGSVSKQLATLDLSSASDTISRVLVQKLLPLAWYTYLDDVRLKHVALPDGSVHTLEMFSSMGNGFTFELETLIFWCLTRAVATLIGCRGSISVYGDDIIAPVPVGRALGRVLPFVGFILNKTKSFTFGSFRESCGGHYFRGSDVTPVYFRKPITNLTEIVQLHNQLVDWILHTPLGVCSYEPIRRCIAMLRRFVPRSLYGGQSLERIDALVTGVAPRQRLVQVNQPEDIPQVGGYLWWLHEKATGSNQTHSPTEASRQGRWVLRPNRSWYEGYLMSRMVHEVDPSLAFASEETDPW